MKQAPAHDTPLRDVAQDQLLDLYRELHQRARALMSSQPQAHTLQATALVHEAFLRLGGGRAFVDREHLLACAARTMRSVLVDHARRKCRIKRKPGGKRVPLHESLAGTEDHALDLVSLDEALTRLAAVDPDMARAVELRLFGSLSIEETARRIGMSQRTFERQWRLTQAWLVEQVS